MGQQHSELNKKQNISPKSNQYLFEGSGNDDLDYVTEKYLKLEEEVGALRLKIKTKLEKLELTRLIPEILPESSIKSNSGFDWYKLFKSENDMREITIKINALEDLYKKCYGKKPESISNQKIVLQKVRTNIPLVDNNSNDTNLKKIEVEDTTAINKNKLNDTEAKKKTLIFIDLPNIETSYFKKTGLKGGYYKQLQKKISEYYISSPFLIYVFTTPNHRLPDHELPNEKFYIHNIQKYNGYADIDSLLIKEATKLLFTLKEKINKMVLITGDKDYCPLLDEIKDQLIDIDIWGSPDNRAKNLNSYANKFNDLF